MTASEPDIKIDLTGSDLGTVISAAILNSLTQDKRDTLIKDSIKYLLTSRKKDTWSQGPDVTNLQIAFNRAVDGVAYEICKEMLKEGTEAHAELQAVIVEGYKKWASEGHEKLVQKISQNISSGIARGY
jgi:hypothetical protein